MVWLRYNKGPSVARIDLHRLFVLHNETVQQRHTDFGGILPVKGDSRGSKAGFDTEKRSEPLAEAPLSLWSNSESNLYHSSADRFAIPHAGNANRPAA